ncbi:hypothetical protein MPTK1_7g01310 [Marchantia polymorpha subsp. ruderalis]|uniref:Uncharacterized protein n=2 Tax=Marchantia polymorpha TaxID=3197 RepID=A0AAF6BV03_MARPO|nr:hypothetical protein MARPO_0099s0005 [Marchantia polymorpha]BBN15837.1 hypothetical protein Mp_7g01310 [Marchantia polymorpha subsp. ruderalis]|eukprot:PTQ32365.1 hypothetical protein MARPO_0099s0005 [Marchantia polymorpha]
MANAGPTGTHAHDMDVLEGSKAVDELSTPDSLRGPGAGDGKGDPWDRVEALRMDCGVLQGPTTCCPTPVYQIPTSPARDSLCPHQSLRPALAHNQKVVPYARSFSEGNGAERTPRLVSQFSAFFELCHFRIRLQSFNRKLRRFGVYTTEMKSQGLRISLGTVRSSIYSESLVTVRIGVIPLRCWGPPQQVRSF